MMHLFQQLIEQQKNVADLEMKLKEKEQEMLKSEGRDIKQQQLPETGHLRQEMENQPVQRQISAEKPTDEELDMNNQEARNLSRGSLTSQDSAVSVSETSTTRTQEQSFQEPKVNVNKLFDEWTAQQLGEITSSNKSDPHRTNLAAGVGNESQPSLSPSTHSSYSSSQPHNSEVATENDSNTSDNVSYNTNSQTVPIVDRKTKPIGNDSGLTDRENASSGGGNVDTNAELRSQNVPKVNTLAEMKPTEVFAKNNLKRDQDNDNQKEEEEKEKELKRKQYLDEQIQRIKELQKQQPQQQQQQPTPYHYEPGRMRDYPSVKQFLDGGIDEEDRPPLQRQSGHYYPRTQFSFIERDANNHSINEEEHLQRLVIATETFGAVVKSLSERQRGGTGPDGFTTQWKVSARHTSKWILNNLLSNRNYTRMEV